MQLHSTLTLAATLLTAPIASAQVTSLDAQQRNHFGGVFAFGTSHRFGRDILLDGNHALVMYGSTTSSPYSLQEFEYVTNGWAYRGGLPAGGKGYTISFGGALALVGHTSTGPTQAGRVGVMRRDAFGGWTNTWLDAPDPNAAPEAFGISTAIDGTTVVIANSEHTRTFALEGAVYIYEDTGTSLVLRQSLYGGAANLHLGDDVSLDGDDLLVGAGYGGGFGVRSFRRSGGSWSLLQAAVPVPPLAAYKVELDRGSAVVRSSNTTLLALANSGNGWFVEGAVTQPNNDFISDFDISDGVIAVAVSQDPTLAPDAGAVRLFARNGGWKLQTVVTASDGADDDNFGSGVALEEARLMVGAQNHDHYGGDNGGAYGFELTHAPAQVYCVPELTSAGCVAQIGFQGTPSVSNPAPFLITATNVLPDRVGTLVYGTNGRIFQPYAGGVRCIAPPRRMTARQTSGNTGAGICGGALSVDFNSFVQTGLDPQLVAGAQVNAQWIFRDPTGPSALASTAAIEFNIRP